MLARFNGLKDRYLVGKFDLPVRVFEKIQYGNPSFINNMEMAAYVDQWVRNFDRQYDLIVGVPRSGLLVACMIATKLGKPLATPENIVWTSKSISLKPIHSILVVDDCISTGKSINTAAERIKALYPQAAVYRGVLFASSNTKNMVDTYGASIDGYQIYQWNVMHFKFGPVGFDIDGVLCEECPDLKNEERYLEFLRTARPYLIPEFEIDYIITSRPEKYRPETEKWLKDHGVRYKNLVMWNVSSKPDGNETAAYKSGVIKSTPIKYYVESNTKQAEEIWKTTRKPCICTDEMRIFD